MKQKIFSISSFLSLFAVSALMMGCADEFDTNYQVEKPATVAEAEALAQYGTLVTYVDAANFRLGNMLASSEFDNGTALASLTQSNFNEVTIPDLFVHSSQVDSEGNIDMLLASSLATDVSEKGLNIFSSPLCASANINTSYLEALIAPETVEEEEVTGIDVINFESDALGTTYPLQKSSGDAGAGSAVVEDDPAGESGHVVHISGTSQSFPAITIKFPEGRKLGDYTDLNIDFYAKNSTALNQKIFCALGGKNAEFKKASEFGCALNTWGRGLINIPMAAFAFSDEQMLQTEVTLVIGPKLTKCDYLIDNITFTYKYRPTYEVEKTPAEKFQIISGELDNFIAAAVETAPVIQSWDIADCPVTSSPDLIWKQTMGETYFAYAAQLLSEKKGDAKIFVSEYLMDPTVRAEFLHLLTADAIGMDKINGIDVLMTVKAPFDVQGFATMLKELAATGKQIRLTIQSIVASKDAEAASALTAAVSTYKQNVQASQRYGITFGAVVESATNAGLWTTGFNRKVTYGSLADALQK